VKPQGRGLSTEMSGPYLEGLRRRFGEVFRLQLELDYIERLLKEY